MVAGWAESHLENANVSICADASYPPPHDVPICAKAALKRTDATLRYPIMIGTGPAARGRRPYGY
eukprot:7486791-Pyramimonas_sp.AAC.1